MKKSMLAAMLLALLVLVAGLYTWRSRPLPPPAPKQVPAAPVLDTAPQRAAFLEARERWRQARDQLRRAIPDPAFALPDSTGDEAAVEAVVAGADLAPANWDTLTTRARELQARYAAVLPQVLPWRQARDAVPPARQAWEALAAREALGTAPRLRQELERLADQAAALEATGHFREAQLLQRQREARYRGLVVDGKKLLPHRDAAAQRRQHWQARSHDAAAVAEAAWQEGLARAVDGGFDAAAAAFDRAAQAYDQAWHRALLRQALPVMVDIPAGAFRMGDLQGRGQRDELPVHAVNVAAFALSADEITFEQYAAYAELSGRPLPPDAGWGRGRRPVINVSWSDAQQFVEWLAQVSGEHYRLPTESEWEYAARAGSDAAYAAGEALPEDMAHCEGCATWGNRGTQPVGGRKANAFGLRDMHGNVWEWVADCYAPGYQPDARADCSQRILRGGSWADLPPVLRASNRSPVKSDYRSNIAGFRVARDR